MKEIVYLYDKKIDINNKYVDAFIFAVSSFSSRSVFELNVDELEGILNRCNKKKYLLMDDVIFEEKILKLESFLKKIIDKIDLILFQDMAFISLANKYNFIDKLMFYSPTLLVSYQDLNVYKNMGIKNFILSKECTYEDYISILNNCSDVNLGMLSCGYPQIYFSKRKMISFYSDEYNLKLNNHLQIKEKSRDFKQHIFEDEKGTYIFAGKIYFPHKQLFEFKVKGMKYFIFDPLFVENNLLLEILYKCLNGLEYSLRDFENEISTFLMFEKMVNNYGK